MPFPGTPWPGGHGPVPGLKKKNQAGFYDLPLQAPSNMPVMTFSASPGIAGGQEQAALPKPVEGPKQPPPSPPLRRSITEESARTTAGAEELRPDAAERPGGSPPLHPHQESRPGRVVPPEGPQGVERTTVPVAQPSSSGTGRRGPSPRGSRTSGGRRPRSGSSSRAGRHR